MLLKIILYAIAIFAVAAVGVFIIRTIPIP